VQNDKNKILVTGANGQLGRCFLQLPAPIPGLTYVFADSTTLDITDRKAVQAFFQQHSIRWCINCAAYTAVDRAEQDSRLARQVNVAGVRNLAEACAAAAIPLIHVSTDYVYHSKQNTPYKEDDAVHPKSVYARSKLAGERAAFRTNPHTMVIRTSWVYAPWGQNFVRTMLNLGRTRDELKVVFDQVGTPTFAPDLAEAILVVITAVETAAIPISGIRGIWHYSNEGVASWYDFSKAIFTAKNINCAVFPIESRDFSTAASRPHFSVLNKAKIKTAFGLRIPHWQESLMRCLEQME
jgi:dTDP-4-dehydrorhamnose reductase